MDTHRWRTFGDFSINLATGELRKDGRVRQMERQPARVLARLVAADGQLVTRRELIRAVWPEDTHVDFDRGLNYCIRQVRIALGDRAGCLETVPRQGYRLVAPPARRQAPRVRRIVAAVAAMVILVVCLEAGPGSEHHHAIAVQLVTTAHNWLF